MEELIQAIGGVVVIVFILLGVIIVVATVATAIKQWWRPPIGRRAKRHFRPTSIDDLAVSERQFPVRLRVDLFRTLPEALEGFEIELFTGVPSGGGPFERLSIHDLLRNVCMAVTAPAYEEIDVGDDVPVKTLVSGFWLLSQGDRRIALLVAQSSAPEESRMMKRTVTVQIAYPEEAGHDDLPRRILERIEAGIRRSPSYRGKALSLETGDDFARNDGAMRVYRLERVAREDVILPRKTIELLERNAIRFVQRRGEFARLKLSRKKGLLFYGPPGTGKTHTIRWLAGAMPDHVTLLIAAEQVGALSEYLSLARMLQPSLVVIEDVDLIARDRSERGPAETLLNKLLNEMDGLKEDCEVLFVLTTNRPEELEEALASRPGRIDQAIEFPLPDEEGREKLVRLYGRGCDLSDDLVRAVVSRTEKVTASFIKELMRRAMQYRLERNGSGGMNLSDVELALDEMLFSGGSLNLKLLGARERIGYAEPT